MEDIEQKKLLKRIDDLEKKVNRMYAMADFFSNQVIFRKKVKFNQNVYDAAGGVVTEINNI